MEYNFNTSDLVRLWVDNETTSFETKRPGLLDCDSILLTMEECDEAYSLWAASDTGLGFYRFAREEWLCWGTPRQKQLTPEDLAIFATIWARGTCCPLTAIEGDAHDSEIFDRLAEAAAESGERTSLRDFNYMEECSFVYWANQTDPSFDFDPIFLV